MYHEKDIDHRIKDYQIFLESKRKMGQSSGQPPSKEVNYTTNWPQPLPTPYYPSYPSLHSKQVHPSTYQAQPPSYYQSYHYATTNQSQTFPLPITYPSPLPQITYPTYQTHQTKNELALPSPPLTQPQEAPQQTNNFPTYGTIHMITRGSNVDL
jgi:hypothetical protein